MRTLPKFPHHVYHAVNRYEIHNHDAGGSTQIMRKVRFTALRLLYVSLPLRKFVTREEEKRHYNYANELAFRCDEFRSDGAVPKVRFMLRVNIAQLRRV